MIEVILTRVLAGFVGFASDPLGFEQVEEALGNRVIPRVKPEERLHSFLVGSCWLPDCGSAEMTAIHGW